MAAIEDPKTFDAQDVYLILHGLGLADLWEAAQLMVSDDAAEDDEQGDDPEPEDER